MPLAFPLGATVRQVVPVLQGMVVGRRLVDDDVQFEVEYVDGEGVTQRRFFKEVELERVYTQTELADIAATEAAQQQQGGGA